MMSRNKQFRVLFRALIALSLLLCAPFLSGQGLQPAASARVLANPAPPKPAHFLYIGKFPSTPELKINPSTGALSFNKALNGVETTNGQVDGANKFLFATSYESGPKILVYSINQKTGDLTPVPGSPFSSDPNDVYAAMFIDPQGQFLYTSGEDVNSNINLTVFRMDRNTGVPTEVYRVGVPVQTTLGWVATDVTGSFVYMGEPNQIYAYKSNKTSGALTPIAGSPFASRSAAMMASVHGYLYTMNSDGTLSGFSINSKSGALKAVAGSPFNNKPQQWMSIDRVHNFLFTTNQYTIRTWRINTKTGRLNLIAKSGGGKLHSPGTILADPSGKYVYVADYNQSNCVFDQCVGATNSYRINASTGELTVVTNQLLYPGDPYDNNFSISVAR